MRYLCLKGTRDGPRALLRARGAPVRYISDSTFTDTDVKRDRLVAWGTLRHLRASRGNTGRRVAGRGAGVSSKKKDIRRNRYNNAGDRRPVKGFQSHLELYTFAGKTYELNYVIFE